MLCMCHVWGRRERCTGVCVGRLIERDHLEDLGVEVRIVLKIDIKET